MYEIQIGISALTFYQ